MAIRQVALAGMISDTSLYNIDGACVLATGAPVSVGTVVGVSSAQPVDGHKVVSLPYDTGGVTTIPPYGVAIRSHYEAADGTYKPQEAINVMTHGRVWVRTTLTEAPAFGSEVFANAQGQIVEGSAGAAGAQPYATGWTFAGGFIAAAANPDGVALIEVQLKQK